MIGFAELVCRLEPGTTALVVFRFVECKKQLILEEELARALVTYRRGCYGCKNV